ncbi:MAG: trypsin-like peptidase domain-containing protein [Myxococcales bacterium]|nr:trypsin-like peptidase domain-containing protein [Myxococcales bacterium]
MPGMTTVESPTTETELAEVKNVEEIKGCKDLGTATASSPELGRRGKIAARNDLRDKGRSLAATHILFVKVDDPHDERYAATAQAARFFQCAAPKSSPADAAGDDATSAAPAAQESEASGTCFFVNGSGLAVTNRHVVDRSLSIKIVLNDGSSHEAMLVRQQANIDLALLQVRSSVKTAFLVPSEVPAALGDQVFTIGFPFGEALGTDPKFVEGTVAGTRAGDDDRLLQTSMIVHPGNSGGALVRMDGSLAGVVFAKANQLTFLKYTGSLAEGISFAVKAPMVQRLLGADAPKAASRAMPRAEAIDNAVRATCRVISTRDGLDFSAN